MEEPRQLEFDFPLPKLEYRAFIDLKYEIKRAETDLLSASQDNWPAWLVRRREQFRAMCGERGHKAAPSWDNGLGVIFTNCSSCGARLKTERH